MTSRSRGSWTVTSRAPTSAYVVTPDDIGLTIVVDLYVTKAGYTPAHLTSAPTAQVIAGVQSFTPAISGSAAVGYTLSVTGLPAGASFSYVWKRGGTSSAIGTAATYKATSRDVGHTITVTVRSTRDGYATLSKTSAKTALVLKAFAWHTPKISGTAKVGHKLTASTAAWSPTPKFKYQWYRDGVAISGATSSTRKLSGYDAGKKITVKLTGYKSGYLTTSKTSAATTVIANGTISVASPSISGKRQAGHTLTAVTHTPSPSSAVKSYQWYRSGVKVPGATLPTYHLYNVDVGKTITVHVTYTKVGYTSRTVYSSKTAVIAKRAPSMFGDEEPYSPSMEGYDYIAPGIYMTTTATDECVWDRDDDNNWMNGFIVRNSGAARWIVEIAPTDAIFATLGCGPWFKYDGTGQQATTVTTDGFYGIGVDIVPGQYQQSGTMNDCYVTLESDASNEESAIVADDNPVADDIITIDGSTAQFFTTWGCGTWTRVANLP